MFFDAGAAFVAEAPVGRIKACRFYLADGSISIDHAVMITMERINSKYGLNPPCSDASAFAIHSFSAFKISSSVKFLSTGCELLEYWSKLGGKETSSSRSTGDINATFAKALTT